jgi:hypothetical protein
MRIAVPAEIDAPSRVAATPDTVKMKGSAPVS